MYVWLRGADLLDMKSSPPWERLDTLAMFSVCLLHSSRLSFSVFRFFVFSFLFFHFSVIIWKSENLKIWLVFFYMYLFFCFLFSFGCCACCVTTPSGLSTSSLHHSSPTSHDRTIQKKTVASHEAAVAKYTLVYNLSFRCTNHSWQRVVTLLPPVGHTSWLFAAIVTSSFLHCSRIYIWTPLRAIWLWQLRCSPAQRCSGWHGSASPYSSTHPPRERVPAILQRKFSTLQLKRKFVSSATHLLLP